MISRRQLVQLMLASLAATHVTACGRGQVDLTQEGSAPKAIVVGAGMAGLKAAQDLQTAGFKVLIIEARDRLGGRIWTRDDLGVPLDMGASWIHGIRGNPISELANTLQTPTFEWDYENGQLTNLSRENGPILETLLDQVERGLTRAYQRLEATDFDVTIGDVVEAARQAGAFKGFNRQEIDFAVQMIIELEMAADRDQVSAIGADEGDLFSGPDVLLNEGYRVLIEHLANGLDVHLSERVTEIDYGGKRVVLGTDKDAYSADFVVLTVPLGVLKKQDIRLQPDLSEAKQAALNGLEMGLLNKLFLRFEEAFWPPEINSFMRIAQTGSSWTSWFNLTLMHDAPILFALNSGRTAKQLEALEDAELIAQAMASLREIFGPDIPEPSAAMITRWASDPYAYGSYSYCPPGSDPALREALTEPLKELLFFAGEATSSLYPATVHGAFLSGQAAAAAITDKAVMRVKQKAKAKEEEEEVPADEKKGKKEKADDGH